MKTLPVVCILFGTLDFTYRVQSRSSPNELQNKEGEVSFRIFSTFNGTYDPLRDVPDVEVTFKSGERDRFVLNHHVALPFSSTLNHAKTCSYLGHLENEVDARIGVTGCLDKSNIERKIYITILSSRSPFQKSFSIDFDGNVSFIQREEGSEEKESYRMVEEFIEGDEIGDQEEETIASKVILGGTNTVPYAIKATIRLGIDISAKDTIENRLGISVDNWLTNVMTHFQTHYNHPTLRHRIAFKVIGETLLYNETLKVNYESLKKLSVKTAELDEDEVDMYAWIVDGGGDNGIAWLGTACKTGSGMNSKTSIVRGPSRYHAIIETAETLSHEVGHNLGMEHDFYTSKSACKLDEDGKFVWCNKCTNWDKQLKKVNMDFGNPGDCCTGFMDYGNHPEYWSNCSVRNFEQHYISQNWAKCMPKDEDYTGPVDITRKEICFNVETVTKKWANEMSWSVGSCESNGRHSCTANGGYFDNMNFTQPCCLSKGDHNLTCYDCYGDTWKGGYIMINDVKYCENFTGLAHQEVISLTACPEEKSPYCPYYAVSAPSMCEEDWFIDEDGRYSCKKSCELC